MDRYLYLLLMAGCVLITLPLEFLFGARVWRRPVRLLTALVPTIVVFTVWDIYAIARSHWMFNPRWTTGWLLPFDVPVEEMVFFVVIPICGLLTYEAVGNMLAGKVSLPRPGRKR